MYELIVDGKSARKVENTVPTKYENVKVWTGLDSFQPAVDGSIRNFKLGKFYLFNCQFDI